MPKNAINSDVQQRRFALLLHAGYGERSGKKMMNCHLIEQTKARQLIADAIKRGGGGDVQVYKIPTDGDSGRP